MTDIYNYLSIIVNYNRKYNNNKKEWDPPNNQFFHNNDESLEKQNILGKLMTPPQVGNNLIFQNF